ncbi:unnamed protein product [Arctogadus glacialis]
MDREHIVENGLDCISVNYEVDVVVPYSQTSGVAYRPHMVTQKHLVFNQTQITGKSTYSISHKDRLKMEYRPRLYFLKLHYMNTHKHPHTHPHTQTQKHT